MSLGPQVRSDAKVEKKFQICIKADEIVYNTWHTYSRSEKHMLAEMFRSMIMEYKRIGKAIPIDVATLKEYLEAAMLAHQQCREENERLRKEIDRLREENALLRDTIKKLNSEVEHAKRSRETEIELLRKQLEEYKRHIDFLQKQLETAKVDRLRRIALIVCTSETLKMLKGSQFYSQLLQLCSEI